ncbi:unnamed protein product [Candida verbasci]|uniref:SP-RING-type domain-containing protein n=1 Tax=Candida verbasci TaxID=1227364 RepID=A0A9W4TYG8_9ASCO|nr:unnamed protein product [Candida verbasci]
MPPKKQQLITQQLINNSQTRKKQQQQQEQPTNDSELEWIPTKEGLMASTSLIQLIKNKPRSRYKKYQVKLFLHPYLLKKITPKTTPPIEGNSGIEITEDDLIQMDKELTEALKPESSSSTTTTTNSNYKLVPKNIVPFLDEELQGLSLDENELITTSATISLLDPLSQTKIKLPVKSIICTHFECFDYENFCTFNNITISIKELTAKNLKSQAVKKLQQQELINKLDINLQKQQIQKRKDELKLHQNYLNQINQRRKHQQNGSNFIKMVTNQTSSNYRSNFIIPNQSIPFYKCPICECSFPLNSLKISDPFNFFVKNTADDVTKIEIINKEKYRILNDKERSMSVKPDEILTISDGSDDEDNRMKLDNLIERNLQLGYKNINHYWNPFDDQVGNGTSDDPILLD